MEVKATSLEGVKIIKPKIFADIRGYFFESFSASIFGEHLPGHNFIQDNESFSKKGVLRGIHYQLEPHAQTKLVRVIHGKIWDVAVDLRASSPSFKKWVGVELSDDNKHQLLVPKGFGHGFLVLSETAIVQYKVDEIYNKNSERGIRYDDPTLDIRWPLGGDVILSEKDLELKQLAQVDVFK